MNRIQITNTSYKDNSLTTPDSSPVFTKTAIENAQPVVPLGRVALFAKMGREWGALVEGRQQQRLLAIVVAFGLLGGAIGGLAANSKTNSQVEDQAATAEVDTANQLTPVEKTVPAEGLNVVDENGPQAGAVAPLAAPPKFRRTSKFPRTYARPAGARKAYRFAVIYGDSDFSAGRKRGRKQ